MGGLNSRLVLRWAFLALGTFLIIRADLTLQSVLALRPFAALLISNTRTQTIVIAAAMIVIIPAGLLCLATFWGFQRNRWWTRWMGLLACVSLLPGLPWFSLIGLTGICVLLVSPLKIDRPAALPLSQDYWTRARNSMPQKVVLVCSGGLLIAGIDAAGLLAQREGLPPYSLGWHWWLYLIPLALVNTAIHELSHAFIAWALHHRLRVISIGPFTWSNTSYGISFHVQWNRLFETSGYIGSVPTFQKHRRLQQIAVIAAGPLSSAFTGVAALAVFLGLPGSGWEHHWEIVALFGVIAFDYALVSAVPLGYSDGSMLFHLIAGTRPGKSLLNTSLLAQWDEEADACQKHADFEKNVEFRGLLIDRVQRQSPEDSMMLAVCRQKLGYAKLLCEDWVGAEREFRTCVGFEAECGVNKGLGVNAWTLLHAVCVERHHINEVLTVYPRALNLLQKRKHENQSVARAVTHTMLAQLYQRSGQFEEALSEATEGLQIVSRHRQSLPLEAMLLAVQAQSKICLGDGDAGLSAARTTASIVRSKHFPVAEKNLAFSRIGELGNKMWCAGQAGIAVDLLRDAIEYLELANAAYPALRQKMRLAAIFRQLEKLEEARKVLPDEDNLPPILLKYLLWERASLSISERCFENAVLDCRRLIELRRAESGADTEIAVAESLLALAHLELGNKTESGALASKALAVLDVWKHFEAVRCGVTMALAGQEPGGQISECVEAAISQMRSDPLLLAPEKARILASEAARLERYSRSADAGRLRRASQDHSGQSMRLPEPAATH